MLILRFIIVVAVVVWQSKRETALAQVEWSAPEKKSLVVVGKCVSVTDVGLCGVDEVAIEPINRTDVHPAGAAQAGAGLFIE
jgi:hypothetical protein